MRYIWLIGIAVILILSLNSIGLAQTCDFTGTWTNKDGSGKIELKQFQSDGTIHVEGIDQTYKFYLALGRLNSANDRSRTGHDVDGTLGDLDKSGTKYATGTARGDFDLTWGSDCNSFVYGFHPDEPSIETRLSGLNWKASDTFYRSAAPTYGPPLPPTYDLELSFPDETNHPLLVEASYRYNGKPVSNAKLRIHALDLPDNDKKLAEYFLSSSGCTNCDYETLNGKKIEKWSDPKQPIEVTTDDNGKARLEFFLPLESPDASIPKRGSTVAIPISVEYWEEYSDGTTKKVAEKTDQFPLLDNIAVVQDILYETPQTFVYSPGTLVNSQLLNREKGSLQSWKSDPGTEDADIVLKGSDRVKIYSPGFDPEATSGRTPGRTLKVGDRVRVNDEITINAGGMVSNGEFGGQPGWISVMVRFLDGTVGAVIVDGDVGKHTVKIGKTPEASGWATTLQKIVHFSEQAPEYIEEKAEKKIEKKTIKIVLEWALAEEAGPILVLEEIYSNAKKVKTAAGIVSSVLTPSPIYVITKSALAVHQNLQGDLLVTTREGNATLYTNATGTKGFPVPMGKTAAINATTLMPVLMDTDTQTANESDEQLANLQNPITSSPVFMATGNITGNVSAGNVTPITPISGANITAPGGSNQTNLTSQNTPTAPPGTSNATSAGNVSAGNVSAGNITAGVPSPGTNIAAPIGMNLTNPTTSSVPTGTTVAATAPPTNNDQLGHASMIASGQAVKQGITPAGSSNWYKFRAGANGIISVDVEGVPSDMRPDVTLYDKNFNSFVEKSATNSGDKLSFKNDIPMPGWIYISVKDADGKTHSEPYTLTANFNAVQDPYDPNNVLGDAAEITPGSAVTASICPHGELDWFKLQANAGGTISVNVNAVPKDMRPGVSLYDKNFNKFEDKQATNAGDSLSFDKDLPSPGWVYITVYDADGKAHSDPYTLTATVKSG